MPDVPAETLADYNAQRLYAATITLYNKSRTSFGTAHFHYQGVLAYLMLNLSPETALQNLQRCPDYTATMEGDLYRDVALSHIRNRTKLGEADELIGKAFELHDGDPERTAVDLQALARLHEAREEITEAYHSIVSAVDELLRVVPNGNTGWLASTAFHATRIAMKMQRRRDAWRFARIAAKHEPLAQRKIAAITMATLPRQWGVSLVEKLG